MLYVFNVYYKILVLLELFLALCSFMLEYLLERWDFCTFPDYTDLTKVMILALPSDQTHTVNTFSLAVSPMIQRHGTLMCNGLKPQTASCSNPHPLCSHSLSAIYKGIQYRKSYKS